jgi:hypothetical protein
MGQLINRVTDRQRLLSKHQNGVAIVEFLISVPLLLLLFAAVAEFGIIFYKQTTLTTAVQDGARYLAGKSIYGQVTFVEIRTQQEIEVKNLVVFGNIWGNGAPLIDGLDITDVTVDCLNGSIATSEGIQCNPDPIVTSMFPFFVKAEFQYVPVFGSMLDNLTGVDVSLPLKASATNIGF